MVEVEYILTRLEELHKEWAVAACLKPQGKEAFDYGMACGRVKGLVLAKEEIERLLAADASEEAERERK